MPRGMGNFSFLHQTHPSAAGREGKTQSLTHPKQNKEGKRFFFPLQAPLQLLEWFGV